jgi:hypothetical protein
MSGEVIYSSAATLSPGDAYLLGLNPGGDATNPQLPTVGGSLDALPARTINGYLDTRWSGQPANGTHRMQRRIVWLLGEALGLDPRAVLATNLIFPRSRDAASSQFGRFADLCWPIHEWLLALVQPRIVLACGIGDHSPYAFLKRQYGGGVSEVSVRSGHGSWPVHSFRVPGRFVVVGFPHFTYYAVSAHPDVGAWTKGLMDAAP